MKTERQAPVKIYYDGVIVGGFVADLIVEGEVLVELKAVTAFDETRISPCFNYLAATGKKICLLINFGKPKVEIKRIVRDF